MAIGVRVTAGRTESGAEYTTHQRDDLRWIYVIDGKASERTYPTAGEAQRGAEAALRAAAAKHAPRWEWLVLAAAAAAPVIYVVLLLLRLVGL